MRGPSGNFAGIVFAMMRLLRIAGVALVLASAPAALAENAPPLPRFAILSKDRVNLRVGPGEQYRIEWEYRRKGYPVEVIAKSDVWRKVRDWQGTEGWVHQTMIAEQRNVIIRGEVRALRAAADAGSATVARAEPGVIAKLLECHGTWCRIEVQGIRGWLARGDVWGVFPDETVP
ncbi:MAG TPA: SH3 domain-containing protein [Stellaceae bacterium]|nr:SH3 domain-containing protein [Stellaceae bacterium]